MTTRTLLTFLLMTSPAFAQGGSFTLNGINTGDRFGESVAALGDIDGDGVSDFAIGASGADYNGHNSGSIDVFSGHTLSLIFRLNGAGAYHRMGIQVASAGDINGDGIPDIAGSAKRDNPWDYPSGYVQVWSGVDGSLLLTLSSTVSWDRFGTAIAGLGDVNGDGLSDIAVGSKQDTWQGPGSGTVRVFSGLDGQILHTWHGEHPWDFFGCSVVGTGDIDGDGLADLAIGAALEDTRGRDCGAVYVLSGRTGERIRLIKGNSAFDTFGYSLARVPDTNGDGCDELAIGGVQAFSLSPDRPGFVQVHSGKNGEVLFLLNEFNSLETFGASLGSCDVDGDGTSDVLVGTPTAGSWSTGNLAGGGVRAFSGRSGRLLLNLEGASGGEYMGTAVCGLRIDRNGDGQEDILVGAPGRSGIGAAEGITPPTFISLDVSNLTAGNTATISASSVPPQSPVCFQASRQGYGGTAVTPWVTLDLAAPLIDLGTSIAGSNGIASISGTVPTELVGTTLYFQAWVTNLYGPEASSRSIHQTVQ
ncbi:MAG TPA: hypothetical protein DDW23_03125 [Planctomycetes bacterium]|nr:hypothetical protein [Planctomycetota bacterium]